MKKNLPPKPVQCMCGRETVLEQESDWCMGCARKIFYEEKDQRRHKFHNLYIYGVMIAVITFLAYVFLELIVRPSNL